MDLAHFSTQQTMSTQCTAQYVLYINAKYFLFFLSIEIIIYHVVYGMYVCCIRFSFGLMYRGNLWCKSRAGRAIKCLNANIAHLCKLLCDTAFYDIEISIFFYYYILFVDEILLKFYLQKIISSDFYRFDSKDKI